MICRLHRPLLWLALGSQILIGVAASSFVLCTEADGASAVELGIAGCCDGSEAEEISGTESWRSSLEDCGACDDAALDLVLQHRDSDFVAVVAVAPDLVPHRTLSFLSAPRILPQAPRAPPELASLRTVALRC